jgi:translation initiation factor 2B subunit (eIF-2B alpha/beta/delta family)
MKKNFMDTISYVRRKDQRIGYHISDEARKSLIFITETPTSKMAEKLLQFLKIDSKQIAEEGGIIGFRFRHSPNRL